MQIRTAAMAVIQKRVCVCVFVYMYVCMNIRTLYVGRRVCVRNVYVYSYSSQLIY